MVAAAIAARYRPPPPVRSLLTLGSDLDLLALQLDWGADEALDPIPRDRLRPSAAPPPSLVTAPLLPAATPVPRPPLVGLPAQAAERAAAALTLDDLAASLSAFAECSLQQTAIHCVGGAGNPAATLMLIGDTPGEAEDRSGQPFAGPAGALLDRMLASIGLTRPTLRLAYLIPWRPPGNRKATPAERAMCLPFALRQIALVAPTRLLLVGATATTALAGPAPSRRAGTARSATIPGLPAPLPAFTIDTPDHVQAAPQARARSWASLLALRAALDQDAANAPNLTPS